MCTVKRPSLSFNCSVTHQRSGCSLSNYCDCNCLSHILVVLKHSETSLNVKLYSRQSPCNSGMVCSLPNYCNVCGQLWLTELLTTSGWSAKPAPILECKSWNARSNPGMQALLMTFIQTDEILIVDLQCESCV